MEVEEDCNTKKRREKIDERRREEGRPTERRKKQESMIPQITERSLNDPRGLKTFKLQIPPKSKFCD